MSSSAQKRRKNVIFTRRIIYGNMAQWLGEELAVEGVKTHKWTCFIRPYNPFEDDFSYIKKVQVILHPTFANHTRTFTKLPIEVSESGWGEFDITIRLFFVDDTSHDITFLLRLFPADFTRTRELCLFEYVDELVFFEPTEIMYQALVAQEKSKPQPRADAVTLAMEKMGLDLNVKAANQLQQLQYAIGAIQNEVTKYEERLKRIEKETEETKKETEQLTRQATSVAQQ